MKTLNPTGDKDGRWDLTLTRDPAYIKEPLVDAKKVDFDLRGDTNELRAKTYFPKRVVDCDHWQLRTFDCVIEGVHRLSMHSGQVISGHGYLSDLRAFADGEEPEIEWPEEGDPECCPDPHGSVESCFPPVIFEVDPERPALIPVRFELILRRKK